VECFAIWLLRGTEDFGNDSAEVPVRTAHEGLSPHIKRRIDRVVNPEPDAAIFRHSTNTRDGILGTTLVAKNLDAKKTANQVFSWNAYSLEESVVYQETVSLYSEASNEN
jgi:hypothetical protein